MPSQVIELWSFFTSVADVPLFRLGRETISRRWLFQVVLLLILVAILARFFKGVLKDQPLPRLGLDLGNREAISTVVSGAEGHWVPLLFYKQWGLTLMMAMTATVLFVLPREGFEQLLKEHPDIAGAIARRQDVLVQPQQELRQLSGQEEDQSCPIQWIRDRLQKLLNW